MFATGPYRNRSAAFSLVELIVVMTLMVVVIGIVAPSLRGFFHGRNLDNEARQFLSLTRYGRSRAIAEGLPVDLWINPARSSYGLQGVSGYTETQTNPMVYQLDESVQVTVSAPPSLLTRSNYWTQTTPRVGTMTKIRFQPDGFISDNSPENIYFRQPELGGEVWISKNPSHMKYEIESSPSQKSGN
jgi:Tfp pilus assembly protein FimT